MVLIDLFPMRGSFPSGYSMLANRRVVPFFGSEGCRPQGDSSLINCDWLKFARIVRTTLFSV